VLRGLYELASSASAFALSDRGPARPPGNQSHRLLLERLEGRVLLSAGDLDPSFGAAGKVTTDFNASSFDQATAIALQPDGKIVVAGSIGEGAGTKVALARYNPDGSPDTTFGSGGKVTAGPNQLSARANGVAVQPDGKLLVVAAAGLDGVVARFHPDGRPDASFGTGGWAVAIPGFDKRPAFAGPLALAPDGKILVAGTAGHFTQLLEVARLNPDGSRDPAFGQAGLVAGSADPPTALALQPDGRILVLQHRTLGRYDRDASPDPNLNANRDPTFGDRGYAPLGFLKTTGLALGPEGKVVVVGATFPSARAEFALARFHANGTVDPAFGGAGRVALAGAFDQATGVALQPDGRIVVVGTVNAPPAEGGQARFAVARCHPDGSPDTTFGTGGEVITGFGPGSVDTPAGVIVQPDGKILVAGTTSGNGGDFALARYLGDGPAGPPNQRFVSQVYLDLLQRPADAPGLAFWAGLLDAGVSRSQIVQGIEASPEYRALVLQGLYGRLLNRPADPAGLSGGLDFLGRGGTAEQLETFLLGSEEYFTRRGGGDNQGFLQALYTDVLQRRLDPSGAQGWGQTLAVGVSRRVVAAAVLASPESAAYEVAGLYGRLLHRRADPGGLAFFTDALQKGLPNELVLAVLAGSDEYSARRT
jgi:uncharacterized delta-60 repeat protein